MMMINTVFNYLLVGHHLPSRRTDLRAVLLFDLIHSPILLLNVRVSIYPAGFFFLFLLFLTPAGYLAFVFLL